MKILHFLGTTALCAEGLLPATAHAQEAPTAVAPSANDTQSVGDIIVTAQKRSQKLNDVGVTIVAATSKQLAAAGVVDITTLAKVTPGFTSSTSVQGYQAFTVRGVGYNSRQASASPTVSTYIDEAALPYSSMTQGLLLDIDHVEVLKGPQGTLFGQNATGGSINVIAAKPTSTFDAAWEISANNFGGVTLDGHVSGPLSETLRGRIAFSTDQFGAWQKGYYLSDRKHGDRNKGAGRVLLDWTPTDRLTVLLNLNANYDHGESQLLQLQQVVPQNPANESPAFLNYPAAPHSNRAAESDLSKNNHSRLYQAVGRIDYLLNDDLTATSITNYIDNHVRTFVDTDGSAFPGGGLQAAANLKSFNQEGRLTGKLPEQHINFILGANYSHANINESLTTALPNSSSLPPVTLLTAWRQANKSIAAFGNIDWEFVPKLTLTGGVRYTSAHQRTNGCTADTGDGSWASFLTIIANLGRGAQGLPPTAPFAAGQCASLDTSPSLPGGLASFLPVELNLRRKEHSLSWRAGLNYKMTPSTLVYVLASRGFKSGGFPAQDTVVTAQATSVRQEKLTAYEAGFKTDLFDRKLSLSAAAFYYDYRDKQFSTYSSVIVLGVINAEVNIPKSKVKGFDFDLTAHPFPGLTARVAGTYADSKVGRYQGLAIDSTPFDFTGKSFNFAPKWSGIADIEYRTSIGANLSGFIGGNALYNSKTYADLANSPSSLISGYTTYDARIGVESRKGWHASLWVRNLTNKYYWTSVVLGSDALMRYTGIPRTFGATFGAKF